jgi:hypothetical protein
MTKIHIDICIPFYTYGCEQRYNLTKKIFHHYYNISNYFLPSAIITFTLVGSEKLVSSIIANSCFKNCGYTYHEYDQENFTCNENELENKFFYMLSDKFKFSFQKSIEKKPNITLLAGSNDYICYDFFKQIIDFYNPNQKQIFGIDNYNNGSNVVLISNYDNKNSKIKIENDIWWNGISNWYGRENYSYCGGIIGFNDCLYLKHYDEVINNCINCDEGEIERKILDLPDVIKFNSKNVFFFNLKTENNSDLNSYNLLINFIKNDVITFTNFNKDLQEKINKEHRDFSLL